MMTALTVFLFTYFLNITLITVLYHRGLAHGAVKLTRFGRFLAKDVAVWLTGIDPKGWVCMHRLHHNHSDSALDPHSPVNSSIVGVFFDQHRSFSRVLSGLIRKKKEFTEVVSDIDFDVHWLNANKLWWLPLALHSVIGVVLGMTTSNYLLGFGYVAGMSSHPVQGWLVNSFGHAKGYQNFDLGDHSRNNTLVAWAVVGEGYQNNHHKYPASAKFSVKWYEVDVGYFLVHVLDLVGVVEYNPKLKPASLETN
ncbi:MAG: acyl-CoA desaturase [Proteobacteria bacterium]|nr:acyl-CoA desaturase [Pseudomonadota bacterium]